MCQEGVLSAKENLNIKLKSEDIEPINPVIKMRIGRKNIATEKLILKSRLQRALFAEGVEVNVSSMLYIDHTI